MPAFVLTGYIVGNQIQLVESQSDNLNGVTGGTALSQGANTGAFSMSSPSVTGVSCSRSRRSHQTTVDPTITYTAVNGVAVDPTTLDESGLPVFVTTASSDGAVDSINASGNPARYVITSAPVCRA